MDRMTCVATGTLLVSLTGCIVQHTPPPPALGAPLPPGSVEHQGFDVGVGLHSYLHYPIATHIRASRALQLGDGPLALELGANASTGWGGISPALHWAPPPRPGRAWRWGLRLGAVAGSGDLLSANRWVDPYLGGSLHGQLSRGWDNGGAFTVALGADYAGHTFCLGGCSYTVHLPGWEDCAPQGNKHCPDGTHHSYDPWIGPSLHLRADLPVGQGFAWMWALGAQPAYLNESWAPVFTISTGLHHRDREPDW
jgi:hypothetical protein